MENTPVDGEPVVTSESAVAAEAVSLGAMNDLVGIGELFKRSFALIKEKFWKMLAIAVVGIIVMMVLGVIATAAMFFVALSALGGSLMITYLLLLVLTLVGIIFSSFVQGSMLSLLIVDGSTIGSSLLKGLKLIIPLFVAMILQTLVVLGGSLAIVIPGILVAVYLTVAGMVIVGDGKRGFGALMESFSLVRGRWWAVFGRALVMGILVAIISGVLTFVGEAIGGKGSAVATVFSVLGNLITVFIASTYMVCLYKNLKETRIATPEASMKKAKNWMMIGLVVGLVLLVALPFIGQTLIEKMMSFPAGNYNLPSSNNLPLTGADVPATVNPFESESLFVDTPTGTNAPSGVNLPVTQ